MFRYQVWPLHLWKMADNVTKGERIIVFSGAEVKTWHWNSILQVYICPFLAKCHFHFVRPTNQCVGAQSCNLKVSGRSGRYSGRNRRLWPLRPIAILLFSRFPRENLLVRSCCVVLCGTGVVCNSSCAVSIYVFYGGAVQFVINFQSTPVCQYEPRVN